MAKMYSPQILESLSTCLATMYWYKDRLRSFLIRAGVPSADVASYDWSRPKRVVIRQLIDDMADQPTRGKVILDSLIDAVVEQDDSFEHVVRNAEDGEIQAAEARRAQRQLKELLGKANVAERAERARREKRTEAERRRAEERRRSEMHRRLFDRVNDMFTSDDPHSRGKELEILLRDLFTLYDLKPRLSYRLDGEEIDGSIEFKGITLLLEARWRKQPTQPKAIRNFEGKVREKLDNTLGLFVSMAGFTENAIKKAGQGDRSLVILMDGQDLMPILQGLHDLSHVLGAKLRRAADEGVALYRFRS